MDLHGKIALVTGGATRVGRAIALALARAGADVALHYGHSVDAARETADEISSLGRRVELLRADLAEPAEIEALFAKVGQLFGRLDVLVNNASLYEPTPIETLTAESWDRQMAVNARAPALCVRHALGLMPSGSAIVNITDTHAETGRSTFIAYSASKGALLTLTKTLARALAARNIRVNAVGPGVVAWEDETDEAVKAKVLAHVPMKRPGSPEDIAAAVVFLAQSDYVTAQILRVDGGWRTS